MQILDRKRQPGARSARVYRIGKGMMRGAAVLLAALFATGSLACKSESEKDPDREGTREEKPRYEW